MFDWLKGLPQALEEAPITYEPQSKPEEGEEVLGELPDELKRVYSLWQTAEKGIEEKIIEIRFRGASEEKLTEAAQLKYKARILKRLFWMGVNDHFDRWASSKVQSIRQGWQVTEHEDKGPHITGEGIAINVSDLLKFLAH